MAWEIIFSQFTLAWTQDQVFNPALVDLVQESEVSAQDKEAEQVVSDMGFYMQKAVNPNMQISLKVGARELSQLTEWQVIPLIDAGKWANKGVEVFPYGGKREVTKLAYDWAKSNNTLKNADPSVAQAIADFVDGVKDLRTGASRDKAIEATRILTQGFAVTAAFWPGSATPWGQSLFDSDHTWGNWAGTFQNVLWGSFGTLNDDLNATSLQAAINLLKYGTKTQRGDKIVKPDYYTLIIPTELEVTAGSVLNTANNMSGLYAGTGSNASLVNTFYFNGNKVKFVSNPWLGASTAEKGTLGNATQWYLANAMAAKSQRALRYIALNEWELEMWYDENTKNRYVSYYHACAFDHYGAEPYLVWSLGTA